MDRSGITLTELLMTVAIAGILLSGGVLVLNSDGVAASQAAQALAANLNRTRFEAIQSNRTAYLEVDTTAPGSYTLWVDDDNDGALDSGERLTSTTFGADDLSRLSLSAANLPTGGAVRFDRRGVPLDALANTSFTITGGGRSIVVDLSSTGRPDIQ